MKEEGSLSDKRPTRTLQQNEQQENQSRLKVWCLEFSDKVLNYLECMQIYEQRKIRQLNMREDFIQNRTNNSLFESDKPEERERKNKQGERKKKRQLMIHSYLLQDQKDISIESKFGQLYEKSISERRQRFQYTFEQLQEDRERQQENQNITCWAQFKKWVCCEGGFFFKYSQPKKISENRSHAYISQQSDVSLVIQNRDQEVNIFNEPHLEQQFQIQSNEDQQKKEESEQIEISHKEESEVSMAEQNDLVIVKDQGQIDKNTQQKTEDNQDVVEAITYERYSLNRNGMIKQFGNVEDLQIEELQENHVEAQIRRVKGKKVQNERQFDRVNNGNNQGEMLQEDKEQKETNQKEQFINKQDRYGSDQNEDLVKSEAQVGYKLNQRRVKKGGGRDLNNNAWMTVQMRKNAIQNDENQKVEEIEFKNFHKPLEGTKKRNQRYMSDASDLENNSVIYKKDEYNNLDDLIENRDSVAENIGQKNEGRRRVKRKDKNQKRQKIQEMQGDIDGVEILHIDDLEV